MFLQAVQLPEDLPNAGPLVVSQFTHIYMNLDTSNCLQDIFDLWPIAVLTEVDELIDRGRDGGGLG